MVVAVRSVHTVHPVQEVRIFSWYISMISCSAFVVEMMLDILSCTSNAILGTRSALGLAAAICKCRCVLKDRYVDMKIFII